MTRSQMMTKNTFNSLTDSHYNDDIAPTILANPFQFPNGFSQRMPMSMPRATILFQFPNGFSLEPEWEFSIHMCAFNSLTDSHMAGKTTISVWCNGFQFPNGFSRAQYEAVSEQEMGFQFPNGFSQELLFNTDPAMVKAFNSLTDSHIREVLETMAVVYFQFPNGFSLDYEQLIRVFLANFQFPNGFSPQYQLQAG